MDRKEVWKRIEKLERACVELQEVLETKRAELKELIGSIKTDKSNSD